MEGDSLDEKPRLEVIQEFCNKYAGLEFVDAKVKDIRHVVPLMLMEAYPEIYGQYAKKVKGIWESKPEDWDANVAFVDPNNRLKQKISQSDGTNSKPNKETCLAMLKYLNGRLVKQGKLTQTLAISKSSTPASCYTSAPCYTPVTPVNPTLTRPPTYSRGSYYPGDINLNSVADVKKEFEDDDNKFCTINAADISEGSMLTESENVELDEEIDSANFDLYKFVIGPLVEADPTGCLEPRLSTASGVSAIIAAENDPVKQQLNLEECKPQDIIATSGFTSSLQSYSFATNFNNFDETFSGAEATSGHFAPASVSIMTMAYAGLPAGSQAEDCINSLTDTRACVSVAQMNGNPSNDARQGMVTNQQIPVSMASPSAQLNIRSKLQADIRSKLQIVFSRGDENQLNEINRYLNDLYQSTCLGEVNSQTRNLQLNVEQQDRTGMDYEMSVPIEAGQISSLTPAVSLAANANIQPELKQQNSVALNVPAVNLGGTTDLNIKPRVTGDDLSHLKTAIQAPTQVPVQLQQQFDKKCFELEKDLAYKKCFESQKSSQVLLQEDIVGKTVAQSGARGVRVGSHVSSTSDYSSVGEYSSGQERPAFTSNSSMDLGADSQCLSTVDMDSLSSLAATSSAYNSIPSQDLFVSLANKVESSEESKAMQLDQIMSVKSPGEITDKLSAVQIDPTNNNKFAFLMQSTAGVVNNGLGQQFQATSAQATSAVQCISKLPNNQLGMASIGQCITTPLQTYSQYYNMDQNSAYTLSHPGSHSGLVGHNPSHTYVVNQAGAKIARMSSSGEMQKITSGMIAQQRMIVQPGMIPYLQMVNQAGQVGQMVGGIRERFLPPTSLEAETNVPVPVREVASETARPANRNKIGDKRKYMDAMMGNNSVESAKVSNTFGSQLPMCVVDFNESMD